MVSLELSPRVQPPRRPSRRPRASKGHVYPSLGDPPPRSPPITSNISPALYRSISTHFGSQCTRIRRTKRLNASFLVDRLEDRTEHRIPLPPLSSFPRFGGARGNAKSAALIGTSLVARFNGLTERERKVRDGTPRSELDAASLVPERTTPCCRRGTTGWTHDFADDDPRPPPPRNYLPPLPPPPPPPPSPPPLVPRPPPLAPRNFHLHFLHQHHPITSLFPTCA